MEAKRRKDLKSPTVILLSVVAMSVLLLSTCSAANGLIGINSAFLPSFLTAPTITFNEGTSTIFVGNSVNVTASSPNADVTYNWSVTGSGSIGSTGSTVTYSAPAAEEFATISVYTSAAGYSDSPATNAGVTVADNHFALLSSTVATNINLAVPAALDWTSTAIDTAYFDRPTITELGVLVDGDYFLSLTLPMSTAVERSGVRTEVHVNGTLYPGAIAESSYIRNNTGGHSESSDHLAILLQGLTNGDTIEVFTAAAGQTGTVTITTQATLYVEYVGAARTIFAAESAASMDTADLYVTPGSAVSLDWTQQTIDTGFTHSDGINPENITLDAAGHYMVYVNVPLNVSGASTTLRVNIELAVQLNGTTVDGGQAQQGFIRRQDNHQNSTLHWSGIVAATTANSVLSFTANKEVGASIADQTVTMNSKKATVFIERIDSGALIYSARATRPLVGTDWNTTIQNIAWESDEIIDTVTYAHSTVLFDSDEVTINRSGDYLVVYNDALILSGADIRMNPRIDLRINGVAVFGAQVKSHYLRNDTTSGNFESSGSLVFYLEGVTAGQILTVTTVEEAEPAGVVLADDFALLTIIRKK